MSTFNTLTIKSTNIDANGTWNRKDVEKNLSDLGYGNMTGSEWIEYVLTRAIDDAFNDSTFSIISEFASNSQILEMKIKSNDGTIYTITKK